MYATLNQNAISHGNVTGESATKNYTVDMRSDTISTPSKEMRKCIYEAVVGDDVYREDPTAIELENKAAKMFGMEAALFVPTGTMANLLAIMVHCSRRGTEAIVGDLSHTFLYEQGGASHIAGVQLATIKNKPDGTYCLNEFRSKIRSSDFHEPETALAIVENTHNMCGGKVLPLEWLEELVKICKEENSNKIALHMDGARIFNAAAVLKLPVDQIVKNFDSVCFCLSKGLTAPVGSVLVGSHRFINEARRLRKALGGGMRQVGILAAAGLYALDEIVPKLGEDHYKTHKIAKAIHGIQSPNVQVDLSTVQTNILLLHLRHEAFSADKFASRLANVTEKEINDGIVAENGKGIVVKVSSRDWEFARIVLYQQISLSDVEMAIKKLIYVIREYDELLK